MISQNDSLAKQTNGSQGAVDIFPVLCFCEFVYRYDNVNCTFDFEPDFELGAAGGVNPDIRLGFNHRPSIRSIESILTF